MKTTKRYQDMTAEELAQATREFDEPCPSRGKPMSKKDRQWFDAWQKKALANEAARERSFVFPQKLVDRIGEIAKQKHTTPAALVKRIVQDALHQAVA